MSPLGVALGFLTAFGRPMSDGVGLASKLGAGDAVFWGGRKKKHPKLGERPLPVCLRWLILNWSSWLVPSLQEDTGGGAPFWLDA